MKQITVVNQGLSVEFSYYDNQDGIILREFEGFEYPSVRAVVEDIAGNRGALYVTSRFGSRLLSWAGDLVGDPDTVFALRRDMLAPLTQQGQLKLIKFTTYDDLELQTEAEIVKVVMPYTHQIHNYLVQALAPDWRFYSQDEVEISADDNIQTITNDGNDVTDPVFKIYGPATDVTITNLNTSLQFEITGSIADGHYIEVDTKNREVKLDGSTPEFSIFEGEFFNLLPGGNSIQFDVTGGGGNTNLITTYRHAYAGI